MKPEERTAPTTVQIGKPCQSTDMQSLQGSHPAEMVKVWVSAAPIISAAGKKVTSPRNT